MPIYPLVVGLCKCSHLTAIYPVPAKERYQKYNYSYTSDNSPVSRLHFKNIALDLKKLCKLNSRSFVVEAGSNDGTFLKNLKNVSQSRVLGVDPSQNISKLAKSRGVKTLIGYFDKSNSIKIKKNYGEADLFYGANVFNHVENNFEFLSSARRLIKNNGYLVLEVPDLKSLIKKNGFDTIYHEHRHYYSAMSISKLLKKYNFKIIKIEKIKYMAGSLRVYAIKKKGEFREIKKYSSDNITKKKFANFCKKTALIIESIDKYILNKSKNNEIVYGIGAATKGNTLLNCLKYSDKIKFILDRSNLKIGKYTPGTGIKIINENKVNKIKNAIILPWNITSHLKKLLLKKKNDSYISIPKIIKNIY